MTRMTPKGQGADPVAIPRHPRHLRPTRFDVNCDFKWRKERVR
jgi:hypothetical protein